MADDRPISDDRPTSRDGVLHVNVVTPTGTVTTADASAVTAPGDLGEFEVLPGHIAFLTSLHPGVMILGRGAGASVYAVSRGYCKVGADGNIEVLVERAIPGADVDVEQATTDRATAAGQIDEWKDRPQDAEWTILKDRLDWAQAQLSAYTRATAS